MDCEGLINGGEEACSFKGYVKGIETRCKNSATSWFYRTIAAWKSLGFNWGEDLRELREISQEIRGFKDSWKCYTIRS